MVDAPVPIQSRPLAQAWAAFLLLHNRLLTALIDKTVNSNKMVIVICVGNIVLKIDLNKEIASEFTSIY